MVLDFILKLVHVSLMIIARENCTSKFVYWAQEIQADISFLLTGLLSKSHHISLSQTRHNFSSALSKTDAVSVISRCAVTSDNDFIMIH